VPLADGAEASDRVAPGALEHLDGLVDHAVAAHGDVAVQHDQRVGLERRRGAGRRRPAFDRLHRVEHHVLHGRLARRQLRGPADGLKPFRLGQIQHGRTIAGDDDARQPPRLFRVFERVRNDGTAQQRREMLVLQPHAARAGHDYGEHIHESSVG
jgi:hypothetical protein